MPPQHLQQKQTRRIDPKEMVKLAAASGARCEFRGCNDYLFEHAITLQDGNFSEHAHIYPFSERGPRGGTAPAPAGKNTADNLMLLCRACHKLVDDNEDEYSLDVLREMKKEHEERIRYVTGFAATHRTHALILKGIVGGRPMDITFDQIREAVAPMYPVSRQGFTIDLTGHGDDTSADYFPAAERTVKSKLKEFYDRHIDGSAPEHVSVFALTSIPLLVLFGRHVSDKIAVDFYHRHRDVPQPWRWRTADQPLSLDTRQLQAGTDTSRIGIVVSMSGAIERASLPANINAVCPLYEIFVSGHHPSVRVLNTSDDLRHFRQTYAALLARIAVEHPECRELHLFIAGPPPVAILCGHERLPKVQPTLCLYDNLINNDTQQRAFVLRLTTR
ncbi:MAG: SAVED domain-containing protein [Hyphomicrobium sp.]